MSQTESHTEIIKLILQTVQAEKIFVLATTKREQQTESIFTKPPYRKLFANHLYLLVLISKEQNSIYSEVQNQIETICEPFTQVTAIAMEMEMFNEWLRAGHPFAVPVKTNALLIHDNGNILFAEPVSVNREMFFQQKKYLYQSGIEKMQKYIDANDLHEAAVTGLMTILKVTIGLELQTNNIDALLNYCCMVVKEIPEIFPGNNYDPFPPIEKIDALLHSLYACHKALTYVSATLTK